MTVEAVLDGAKESYVEKMICVGCDLKDSQLALDFAGQHQECWASVGIHPHEAGRYVDDQSSLDQFKALVKKGKIVAIGECGLDFYYHHSNKNDQVNILRFQLELAQKANLPVIFHVRDAFDDFWPIYEQYSQSIKGVLHSFTDSVDNLKRAVGHGLFIGVNGIATFTKDAASLAMYRSIPLSNLLLETDAPFLTPTPYRGTINQPKHIFTVAEFLAEQRQEKLEQLAAATTTNAETLFGI